nr:unnamed protein product [Callosobruchus analis]
MPNQSETETCVKPSGPTVFCYFCESHVTNFPRLLSRNRGSEIDVQRMLSLRPLSKERKDLLYSLQKKGNYLLSNESVKSVRKGAGAQAISHV